jgi:uncharacterized protein (DUF58 family)
MDDDEMTTWVSDESIDCMASISVPKPASSGSSDLAVGAHVDPTAYMAVKDLMLRAKGVVEGFYHGLHRSPFHGFSVEFSEYRPYTIGDDPRGLDWRLYARTDRYYIKRFEDETNRRCYLVLDQSRSMHYGSLSYTKIEYARTLAATLAYYLSLQRDSVGLLTFDDEVRDFLVARHRPGHLRQLMVCLSRASQASGTDLDAPLQQIASIVKKRGLVILISDMLASVENLRIKLGYLRSRGHEVIVLRVLDPMEKDFQLTTASMIRDLESGRKLFVDPVATRADYLSRFEAHAASVRTTCEQLGIDFHEVITQSPLHQVLLHVIRSRQFASRSAVRPCARRRLESRVEVGSINGCCC